MRVLRYIRSTGTYDYLGSGSGCFRMIRPRYLLGLGPPEYAKEWPPELFTKVWGHCCEVQAGLYPCTNFLPVQIVIPAKRHEKQQWHLI